MQSLGKRVVFSGIQPTGIPHARNYLGAFKNWVKLQNELSSSDAEIYFSVVGLHAITLPQQPQELRRESSDMLTALLALGLDPERCTIFRQEQVKEHTELAWYLSCIAPFGRLQRMTTWKSKIATMRNANHESEVDESLLHLGLFAYPVLQAADILLYGTTDVPVGEDQEQHIELARDLAGLFNKQFKTQILKVPRHVYTPQARVLNLRDPASKMSKSHPDPRTRIMLADSPTTARAKLQSAVTDSLPHVSYEPTSRPGVSNLISILSGLQDTPPQQLAGQFEGKSLKDLKDAVGDALEPLLIRFQNDFSRIRNETGFVKDVERKGREKATRKASETMEKVRTALGLEYEG
ncbi:MAG: Tryptophan--tRNA ligase, mitochondrial [Cyphobasidiales sp. Tagirdzhanova-0007]|nr:MAG: Tryptophan--tRNA ligase, mitochondrial [Cyphobasidiales sp. Tagirdzhanova-0007]